MSIDWRERLQVLLEPQLVEDDADEDWPDPTYHDTRNDLLDALASEIEAMERLTEAAIPVVAAYPSISWCSDEMLFAPLNELRDALAAYRALKAERAK